MSRRLTEETRSLRAERLIAAARFVLAGVSLAAIALDPSEPQRYASLVFLLLVGYLACASILGLVVWAASSPPRRLAVAAHVFDLAMFGSVVFFTRGPSSPFFVFFIFALVSAALRWQWAGTLWTGGAAVATLLGTGLLAAMAQAGPELELNRFLIRGGYLVVIAILLGYLGNHEKRLREEASRVAAMEERMRVAYDLHDGVVQSLTGATLRLGALPGLMERDPEAALETARRVEELLLEEQRDLRVFMTEARELLSPARAQPLEIKLAEICRGIERHWNLRVRYEHDLDNVELPPRLANELGSLLREALANAARHGNASSVDVRISRADRHLGLRVADDGSGFPFQGRYGWAELQEEARGPRSLKRRVAGLGGTLSLDSSDRGTVVEMEIPLGPRAS